MAISSLLNDILELQKPISASAQNKILRNLKNELVGHPQRKEAAIQLGIVGALVHVLSTLTKTRGKKRTSSDTNGSLAVVGLSLRLSDEDGALLQAITIIGTLAHGGLPFVMPLISSSPILALLVEALRLPHQPPRLRTATLKALLKLSDVEPPRVKGLPEDLFQALVTKSATGEYAEILIQTSPSSIIKQQVGLTAQLVRQLCRTEAHRATLVSGGVLDALASVFTSYCVQNLLLLRSASSLLTALPPTPTHQSFTHVLSAIASVIRDSRYRAARLVYSPLLVSFFPIISADASDMPYSDAIRNADKGNHAENFLPRTPAPPREEQPMTKVFPSLGSLQPPAKSSSFIELADPARFPVNKGGITAPDVESALIIRLISLMRYEQGLARLYTAEIISILLRAGFLTRIREKMLALLVVPLLVNMIDLSPGPHMDETHQFVADIHEVTSMNQMAPVILADLVSDSNVMQKAANDANALQKACKMLRDTYAPVAIAHATWRPDQERMDSAGEGEPSRTIWPQPLPRVLVPRMKVREANLILIAAIGERDDKYRKYFQEKETNIIPFIVDSLIPLKDEAIAKIFDGPCTDEVKAATLGNTDAVLIAACNAIRALSRSVSLLRTSLVDAGTASPVFALLTHPNVDVMVAATDVTCNLLIELSPLRQEMYEAGVSKILCEHARSADSRIRRGSLWALKHLVHRNDSTVKIACFEELGGGWLVQIISGGNVNNVKTASPPTASSVSLGAANAAGERVDILNTIDEPMDMTSEAAVIEDDPMDADGEVVAAIGQNRTAQDANIAAVVSQHRGRLQEIRSVEASASMTTPVRNEMEVQVQALDFLRNLILGPAPGDMIDCIFSTLGSARIFQLVLEKLKQATEPTPTTTATATTTTTSTPAVNIPSSLKGSPQLSPPDVLEPTRTELARSSLFVLNHIAGGTPTHRTLLTSQHTLLRALLPLFHHPDQGVRVVCVWIVISLAWHDDDMDTVGARQRAFELRGLGFEERLRSLQNDESLDVRERVKTVLQQFSDLMDGHALRSSR